MVKVGLLPPPFLVPFTNSNFFNLSFFGSVGLQMADESDATTIIRVPLPDLLICVSSCSLHLSCTFLLAVMPRQTVFHGLRSLVVLLGSSSLWWSSTSSHASCGQLSVCLSVCLVCLSVCLSVCLFPIDFYGLQSSNQRTTIFLGFYVDMCSVRVTLLPNNYISFLVKCDFAGGSEGSRQLQHPRLLPMITQNQPQILLLQESFQNTILWSMVSTWPTHLLSSQITLPPEAEKSQITFSLSTQEYIKILKGQ